MQNPTHTAPPVALDRLVLWRNARIAEARERGDEFFMGLPDAWYESPTWACVNGHVSARYLKSEERGAICLACQTLLWLIPRITETELAEILSENDKTEPQAPQ